MGRLHGSAEKLNVGKGWQRSNLLLPTIGPLGQVQRQRVTSNMQTLKPTVRYPGRMLVSIGSEPANRRYIDGQRGSSSIRDAISPVSKETVMTIALESIKEAQTRLEQPSPSLAMHQLNPASPRSGEIGAAAVSMAKIISERVVGNLDITGTRNTSAGAIVVEESDACSPEPREVVQQSLVND